MKQNQLAEAAQLDPSTIRNVETQARSSFDDVTLAKISKALGWPADTLRRISNGEQPRTADTEVAALSGRWAELTEDERQRVLGYIDAILSDR